MGLESAGKPEIAQQDADGDSADHLESGLMPGLNTDHFHTAARELLFQHNSHGVPVAFQSHNDVAAVGLPQINIFNSSNQTELHTGVQNNLAPHDNEIAPPHDALPAPADGKQPPPQNGEIKVENYVVKKGDSLWKIAREHLESGASNREVANYVKQIEADNPMPNPNLIMPGQLIKVRSYAPAIEHDTAHGAEYHNVPERHGTSEHHGAPEYYHNTPKHYRNRDHEGLKQYPYPNHKEHEHDNNGKPQQPSPDTTQHKGVLPLQHESHDAPLPIPPQQHDEPQDDPPQVKDQEEKLLEPFKDAPVALNIEQDRRQLAELAHNRMGDGDEYSKFVDSMNSFEHRVNSNLADKLRLQGKNSEEVNIITAQEIHDTYKNAGDLLRTQQTDKLTPVELQHLASEEMQQAAHWQDIDQGQHPTCQSTAIEKRLYADNPSLVTQIVTQAALTGKYTAPDETTVEIDPSPHDKEAQRFPTLPGQRSHASQIFDDAAVNVTWAKLNPRVHYEWRPASRASGRPAGSYLMMGGKEITSRQDKGMSAPISIRPGDTGILEQDIPLMFDTITGKHDESAVILASQSPEALQNKVQELKQRGDLPAVFAVNAGNKPFSEYADGPGGHLVLLDDYIPAKNGHPAEAMVDNSWGFTHDGERAGAGLMTFQTLYKATLVPATQSR